MTQTNDNPNPLSWYDMAEILRGSPSSPASESLGRCVDIVIHSHKQGYINAEEANILIEYLVKCFAAYQIAPMVERLAPMVERLASDIDDIFMRLLEQSDAT